MGRQGRVGDRLRQRLRDERERRGLSQQAVAQLVVSCGGPLIHASTVGKIESGNRDVTVDELNAFADVFRTSVDTLIGRSTADLAWAAANLTANAQKAAAEVATLQRRLRDEYDEARAAVNTGGPIIDDLLEIGGTAIAQLATAQDWLNRLANQFPLSAGAR